jgi:hypothetical protein
MDQSPRLSGARQFIAGMHKMAGKCSQRMGSKTAHPKETGCVMDIREQIRHLREMGLIDFLKEKIPTMSEAELF